MARKYTHEPYCLKKKSYITSTNVRIHPKNSERERLDRCRITECAKPKCRIKNIGKLYMGQSSNCGPRPVTIRPLAIKIHTHAPAETRTRAFRVVVLPPQTARAPGRQCRIKERLLYFVNCVRGPWPCSEHGVKMMITYLKLRQQLFVMAQATPI